jgi:hypothetical protein
VKSGTGMRIGSWGWAACGLLNLAFGNFIIAGLSAGAYAYCRSKARQADERYNAFLVGYAAGQQSEDERK